MVPVVGIAEEWTLVRDCYPILARLMDEAGVPFDEVVDVVDWVPIPEGEEGHGPGKRKPLVEKHEAHGWYLLSGGPLRDTEEWPEGPWWPNYYLSHDGRVSAETFAETREHRPGPREFAQAIVDLIAEHDLDWPEDAPDPKELLRHQPEEYVVLSPD